MAKEEFNQRYAEQLQAQHRYFELADYLTQYNNGNRYEREMGYQQIVALQQQGRQYSAIYNKANPSQRQAIDFLETLGSNGTFEKGQDGQIINPFGRQYINALNNLCSTPNQQATTISIKFEPQKVKRYADMGIFGKWDFLAADEEYGENAYDLYLKQNGLTTEDLKNIKGVRVTTNKGITTVDIDKTSPEAVRLLTGLQAVDSNHSIKRDVIDPEETNATRRYFIAGKDGNGNIVGDAELEPRDARTFLGLPVASPLPTGVYDPDFKGYSRGGQEYTINQIVRQAQELQDKVTGGKPQHFSNSLMVSSASSAAEEQVLAARRANMITDEQMKNALEWNRQQLDNQIIGQGFKESNIFVSGYAGDNDEDNESREYEQVSNPDQRNYYENLIKQVLASSDGSRRVHYYMAASGNMFGTKIVIDPKEPTTNDKTESNTVEDGNGEGPEIARPIEIFVEGWNGQDAEQSLRKDTKTRAALEANNMEQYNYDMDIPQEGTLSCQVVDGAPMFTLTGNDGNTNPVTKEDAQRLLNKRFILEDVTQEANNSFYDPTTGNSLYQDAQGKINQANLQRATNNAYKLIDIRAQQAMQDLYPETIAHMDEYKQNGMDVTSMQEAYDKERESIAAYIKTMINPA